jgi:hypothetical protein
VTCPGRNRSCDLVTAGTTSPGRRLGGLVAWALATGGAAAHAGPVQGVRTETAEPIAVRGGVLMMPLVADSAGDRWPTSLKLVMADGRRITGVVAWIQAAPPATRHRWADDPRGLRVRRIERTDDTSVAGSGAPYLLARLPADGDGPLRLGRQSLLARWRDRPGPAASREPADQPGARATLPLIDRADRPDPNSPFEYWRWVLLAERLDMDPPSTDAYRDVGSLVAEHFADLWRVGLARLAAVSAGVAAQCRDLLTQTCLDRHQPFAAWVADPAEVGRLLLILLSFERPGQAVMEAALAWADEQDLLLIRPEPGTNRHVTVAIANPTYETVVARLTWIGSDEIPVAARLDPGVLTRVDVERPASTEEGDPGPAGRGVLLVEAGGRVERLSFRRPAFTARPPGVVLSALRPSLTLGEVQTRRPRPVAADRTTIVQFRKQSGRWEVFFECRRPAPSPAIPSGPDDLFDCAGFEYTRGIEAVTVLLGPGRRAGGPSVALTVPENGRHRLFRGSDDGTLEVHQRSYGDRWLGRIVFPAIWLPASPDGPALVGLVRTHGDSDATETGPYPTLPWRLNPGRVAINTTVWDDLPPERASGRPRR